jgi:hypothetical protein
VQGVIEAFRPKLAERGCDELLRDVIRV